jgi:hypothetical protein
MISACRTGAIEVMLEKGETSSIDLNIVILHFGLQFHWKKNINVRLQKGTSFFGHIES